MKRPPAGFNSLSSALGRSQPSSALIASIIARRLNTKSHNEPPIWRHSTAELVAICSRLGRIPTKAEYMADIGVINEQGAGFIAT